MEEFYGGKSLNRLHFLKQNAPSVFRALALKLNADELGFTGANTRVGGRPKFLGISNFTTWQWRLAAGLFPTPSFHTCFF